MQTAKSLAISKYNDGTYLVTDNLAIFPESNTTNERHDHISLEQAKKIINGRPYVLLGVIPELEQ